MTKGKRKPAPVAAETGGAPNGAHEILTHPEDSTNTEKRQEGAR